MTTNAFIKFDVLDLTGEYEPKEESGTKNFPLSNDDLFENARVIVYVIDAHDEDHTKAVSKLASIVTTARRYNPSIVIVTLIHKMDGDMFHDEDHRMDTLKDIQQQVKEAFDTDDAFNLVTFSTSIYDNSIYEAFSKTVQKINLKQLEYMENLMNSLTSCCGMEKTFLFDVSTKLYICTDSNPVDGGTLELCSNMIDVVLDVSEIYGCTDYDDSNGSTMFRSSAWFNEKSSSIIRLTSGSLSGMVLYLREIHHGLAIVCLIRGDNFKKQGIIDFNIEKFRTALSSIFKIKSSSS